MPGQVMRYIVNVFSYSGYYSYRQGDKTSADVRTEASEVSKDTMATASLDTISEDEDHVMPAPPLPSSSVNAYYA